MHEQSEASTASAAGLLRSFFIAEFTSSKSAAFRGAFLFFEQQRSHSSDRKDEYEQEQDDEDDVRPVFVLHHHFGFIFVALWLVLEIVRHATPQLRP
jgi:hypothetical protein